jgi:hypothetical protein
VIKTDEQSFEIVFSCLFNLASLNVDVVKEKLLGEIARSRGSTYESDPFAGEKRLELIPRAYMGMKERSTDTGIVTIGTRADGICHKRKG